MNRVQQVEYCKRCTKQMFDLNHGILCSLTHQKADFETECTDFIVDESKANFIQKKQENSKKSKIAFGLKPGRTVSFSVSELSYRQLFVIAYQAASILKWKIGTSNESGFIAYTGISFASWGEEVKVKIGVGNISITSQFNSLQIIDWGKNSRNIEKFISKFNEQKVLIDNADINDKYDQLAQKFIKQVTSFDKLESNEKNGKLAGFFSLFNPTEGYFVTPILVWINVFLFILMVVSGANFVMPSIDSLILWGANLRPLTIDGQWWRLVTSTFLHIGFFHLLMNMYALIYIGLLLEPYLGKIRFISAYLLSGIVASATSISWLELTVSAGASGAIFGLYGIFLALLTTNIIEKKSRISLLISIGFFVLYNLINGFQHEGIDNAAHIGGLLSGLVIGYSFYPGLKKNTIKSQVLSIGTLTLLIGLGSFYLLSPLKSDFTKFQKDMEQFGLLEQSALRVYRIGDSFNKQQTLDELQKNSLPKFNECVLLLNKMSSYDLPEAAKLQIRTLKTYCELRIKLFQMVCKSIEENTTIYDAEINEYTKQIEKILTDLSKSN